MAEFANFKKLKKMSFLPNLHFSSSRAAKTFKPKKNVPETLHQHILMKHSGATLGAGNLREAVKLPEGEDLNEWCAVHIVDFFKQISMLFGTITDACTELACPIMSAGPKYEYQWADGQAVKTPIKCSAPKVRTFRGWPLFSKIGKIFLNSNTIRKIIL